MALAASRSTMKVQAFTAAQSRACPIAARRSVQHSTRVICKSGANVQLCKREDVPSTRQCLSPTTMQQPVKGAARWIPQVSNSSLVTLCGLAAVAASLLLSPTAHAEELPLSYVQELQQLAEAYIPGVLGDSPLREGFVSGFLLILFSEIGDKTFFIAVLLALKQSQAAVFTGTFGALAVMTVVSVGLGQVLHKLDDLLPQTDLPLDDLLAVALLVYFGVKTLQDAAAIGEGNDEKEEAEEAVAAFGSGGSMGLILSTFALVFAAEWGDKSFLATIALSAASSPLGVVLGAVAGHGVATGMAVVGGSMLSKFFSERALQYTGGVLFLVFAAATAVDIFR